MAIVREYKAVLYENDQVIDETVIDENDEAFAMYLFEKEFGHNNLNDTAHVIIDKLGLYDTVTGNDVDETPENLAKVEADND